MPQRIVDWMTGGSRQQLLRPAAGWAAAGVVTLAALGTASAFSRLVPPIALFQPFYVALVIIATWAGPWPALASLAVGTLTYLTLWIEPVGLPWASQSSDQILTLAFLVTGLVIIGVCTLLRNVRSRARSAEDRLALAQEEVGVAVWEVDLRRGSVLASEQGWRMHGLPAHAAAGTLAEWVAPLHPDDRRRIERRIAESAATGDRFEIEFRVDGADGEQRWLSARIRVHRDPRGRPVRTSGVSLDVTEARRLRDARTASEQQLRLITDALPVLIAYIDGRRHYRFVNAAYEAWFCLPASEIVGRPLEDVVGPTTHAAVRPYLERALAGESVRYRTRVESPRFGLRDVAVTYVPQTGADGRVEGVVSLVDDVTDEMAAAQRLRESEERLQLAMEGARMGTWFRDAGTGQIIWDRQHFRLLGLDPDRVMKPTDETWIARVHPDDRERVLDELRSARATLRTFDMQLRIVRADDGEERWLSMHGRYLENDDGNGPSVRSIGIVFDVSDQKRAEMDLRHSEALYRTLGEAVPDLVWSSGADGRPDYVNRQFTEYTGLTLEQFQRIGWTSLVHADDADHVAERWRATNGGSAPFEAEFRGRRHDGEYRWLWCRALPLRDAEGRTYKWVGFASDVTERRRTEEYLRRTEAALREADKRKDEFLATLAHELRNPLAPIRYAVRLLKAESPPHALAQGRETIERQATHMARLLDDLLDMSRITRGAIELKRRSLDLRQAVEDSIEVARPLIDGVHHRLEVDVPALPVWVNADPTRLAQIVGNLLQNAAKYTDPGGSITVRVESDGNDAVLRVIDTGIGLAPEMRERVFELFSQVHRSITSPRGGLGIGLAIVKRLVELHGGSIEVRSEGLGRGSEFVVRLPRSTVAATPVAVRAPVPPGSRRRVLVVDDNADAVDSLATLLRLAGHVVQVAHDGAAAIALAETARPDVVVLDLGMPRMSGYDVARWLRRQPWGADIKLIAVTGWGQDEDRRRSQEAGFEHHLTKPVDPDELLALLAGEHAAIARGAEG